MKWGEFVRYAFVSGLAAEAEYCPFCGDEIFNYEDGANKCTCGKVFYVIEDGDPEESEE